jgi:hypothetical protein
MTEFRVRHSSWYQIPVLYGWWDRTVAGAIEQGERAATEANGHANGGMAVGEIV